MATSSARKEYMREYRIQHKESIVACRKQYHEAHKERAHLLNKVYREKNKVRLLANRRKWYLANKEREAASNKEWILANSAQAMARNIRWRLDNPEKVREGELIKLHRRRALIAGSRIGPVDLEAVRNRHGWLCGICGGVIEPDANGEYTGKQFHYDHKDPLSRGGSHTTDNLQLAHPPCNLKKWAHLSSELVAK